MPPAPLPRARGASWGRPPTTCPASRASARATPRKWINQYDGLDNVVAHADEITGKEGEALRDHLGDVIRNRQLNALVRDLDLDGAARPTWRCSRGTAHEVHTVFDGLEFRVLRDRLFETLDVRGAEVDDSGFERRRHACSAPARSRGWLAEHAPRQRRVPACTSSGLLGRRHRRRRWSVALAAADGTAAWFDAGRARRPTTSRRSRPGSADPARPKALHDAKGPMLALAARGWTLRGLDQRHRARRRTSSGPTSAPTTWPTSRCATSSASCGRRPPTPASSAFDDDRTTPTPRETAMLHARAVLDLADALDDGARGARRHPAARRGRAAAGRRARRDGAAPASPSTRPPRARSRRTSAARCKAAADEAYAVIGKEINLGSPKQLQVVLFDELGMPKTKRTKTGYTTDADALQALFAKTEHPFLRHLLRHRDVDPAAPDRRGAAQDGRRRRPHPHHVQPDDRGDRPAVDRPTPTCRTSRSAPRRAAGSARASWSAPATSALMTADYSQIEMRIMAHLSEDAALIEAFHSGEDFHSITAVAGLRRRRRRRHRRDARQDQGDELRPGLRPVRVRPVASSSSIEPGEARGLMDEYFETLRRRPRLPRAASSTRPARTGFTETILGRRRYLPDLTSDNRQRREMAERMALNAPIQGSAADIIKVAMLGVDRAHREPRACARGCCSRCTTSSCSRWRRGSATALEALVRARDGRRRRADRAARRLGRHRPHLARRRALTGGRARSPG